MKNVLFVAMLLFFPIFIFCQTDTIPKSAVLQGNNIQATVNSNGLLFHDIETGEGGFFHDDYPDIPLIKSVGFWVGGIDPGGNLKVAAMRSNPDGKRDFIPGYYDKEDYEAKDFNYIASVLRLEIAVHRQDFETDGVIDFPIASIFSWPGRGNPYFEAYTGIELPPNDNFGLAPFHDENDDGIYNPMEGDYPTTGISQGCFDAQLIPEQIIWTMAHDVIPHTLSEGNIAEVLVHTTAFAYDCTANPLYSNTIGVRYQIINLASEDLDSTFFGVNVDFDLGCPSNDYVGVSPDNRMVFAYNSTDTDEDCGDFTGLGTDSPVILCHFAKGPLDEDRNELDPLNQGMTFINDADISPPGIGDPNNFTQNPSIQYYRYLSGSWRDGSPLEFGGDGYQEATTLVNLPFTDNPNDSNGWSEATAENPAGDRNFIGCTKGFTLKTGAVNEIVVGFSVLQDVPFETLYQEEIRNQLFEYYNGFCTSGDNCGQNPTSTNEAFQSDNFIFSLYPNPTSNLLNLDFKSSNRPNQLKIFDLHGKELWSAENAKNVETIAVDWLPAGVYFLETNFSKNSVRKKFIVTQK